jgi:hypothetical protein
MKKWLILAYIISVLTISGLAKAESQDVIIENYTFDSTLLSLVISGSVQGNCGTNITSEIIGSQATEDLPILLIAIDNKPSNCQITNKIYNRFDTTLDLRALGVRANSTYYVMFNNLFKDRRDPLFTVKIPADISQNTPHTEQIRGILKREGSSHYYLDTDGTLFPVKSNVNLVNYLNNKVIIDALKFIYQVEPGFDLNSEGPLRTNLSEQSNDLIYILGISTI